MGSNFLGCKTATIDHLSGSAATLLGKWELREVQAGMTPVKNYAPGNGNSVEFTKTTYKRFSDGILTKSGNYTVVLDNTVMDEVGLVLTPGEFDHRIVFDEDTRAAKIFVHITKDKLTLLSGFLPVEGGTKTVYDRK